MWPCESAAGRGRATYNDGWPAARRLAVTSFWSERGGSAEELQPATPAGPEFWISVGSRETEAGVSDPPSELRQELAQVAGCVSTAAALRTKGYRVSYRGVAVLFVREQA